MSELASVISTVGFPIVSFLISAYFIKYCYDKQIEKDRTADERDEKHWEAILKLTDAVNNNTTVLSDNSEIMRDFVKHTIGGDKE